MSLKLFEPQHLGIQRPADARIRGEEFANHAHSMEESQTLSLQTSNRKSSDAEGISACNCMDNALIVLDKLEIQKVATFQSAANTIDGILSSNKSAIAQCSPMLDCLRCCCIPSCIMLLILICRNLVSQFQRILPFLHGQQYSGLVDRNPAESDKLAFDSLRGRQASLGNYRIDTSEEWMQMLHALAIVRGRSLAMFLDRLKSTISYQNWIGHRGIIEEIESQHRSTMTSLQKRSNETL